LVKIKDKDKDKNQNQNQNNKNQIQIRGEVSPSLHKNGLRPFLFRYPLVRGSAP
jgi:hypothetical protein